MKPVLTVPGTDFVVCFHAMPEEMNMRKHFINECGWTEAMFRPIRNMPWFIAVVSLWHRGECLGEEFLGGCCYKTEEEFYTVYAGDYFADMVCELADNWGDDAVKAWAPAWREANRTALHNVKEEA